MPEEYRAFLACRIFGWTEDQYAHSTARFVDLAFEFEAVEREDQERRQKEASQ